MSEAARGALGSAWEAPGILRVSLSPGVGDSPLLVESLDGPVQGALHFDLPVGLREEGSPGKWLLWRAWRWWT